LGGSAAEVSWFLVKLKRSNKKKYKRKKLYNKKEKKI